MIMKGWWAKLSLIRWSPSVLDCGESHQSDSPSLPILSWGTYVLVTEWQEVQTTTSLTYACIAVIRTYVHTCATTSTGPHPLSSPVLCTYRKSVGCSAMTAAISMLIPTTPVDNERQKCIADLRCPQTHKCVPVQTTLHSQGARYTTSGVSGFNSLSWERISIFKNKKKKLQYRFRARIVRRCSAKVHVGRWRREKWCGSMSLSFTVNPHNDHIHQTPAISAHHVTCYHTRYVGALR